jgi:hypothetical protein
MATEGGSMAEQPGQPEQQRPPEMMEFWRQWLTESERQFNSFFNSSMNTDGFARSAGSYMEMYAGFQRLLAEGMQRYLTFINMPSRTDVIGLGEMLRVIEARLARIEHSLLISEDAVGVDRGHIPVPEPARTRTPPEFAEAVEVPPPVQQYVPPPPPEPVQPAAVNGPALSEEEIRALLATSERLLALEERLGRIEETLRIAMEMVEATEASEETPSVVEEQPVTIENGSGIPSIPEELRR